MPTTTKHSPQPAKKRCVHVARNQRAARSKWRVISSGDFLGNPKLALALAAKGTQVCIKGGKAQIILGLKRARAAHQKRHPAVTRGKSFAAGSKLTEPLNVSWIE